MFVRFFYKVDVSPYLFAECISTIGISRVCFVRFVNSPVPLSQAFPTWPGDQIMRRRMKMKKILAMLLALAMMLSLFACGSGGTPSDGDSKTSTAPTETKQPDQQQGGGDKTAINVIISQYGNYTQE